VVLAIVAGLTATAAVFSLAAGPIVRLLFGPAYENAIPLLRWMAPTQAVLVAGLISLYVLFQSGRMAAATAVLPFGLAAFLLTAMALTPRMGPAGATLGLAAAGLVFLGYTAAQARGAAGRAAPPAPAGARSSAAGRVSADEPPPR
jgi:O-antigen/teichoic acid export membrane protein